MEPTNNNETKEGEVLPNQDKEPVYHTISGGPETLKEIETITESYAPKETIINSGPVNSMSEGNLAGFPQEEGDKVFSILKKIFYYIGIFLILGILIIIEDFLDQLASDRIYMLYIFIVVLFVLSLFLKTPDKVTTRFSFLRFIKSLIMVFVVMFILVASLFIMLMLGAVGGPW